MKKTLYLIDGYGLIFKSYFAFMGRPLNNSKGENISAIIGFFRGLFSLIKQKNPDFLAVAMDAPWPTFRHDLYPEYKAKRDETPQDLKDQIQPIWDILKALGIPVIQQKGFEADDILGTLAVEAEKKGLKCSILSSDKDLLQLVNEDVHILKSQKGTLIEMDAKAVLEDKGVSPNQIVDYLALIGDQSDNVPGVKGIGPKTACTMLGEYKTLENLYDQVDNLKSKAQQKKLIDSREMAFFSKKLVTICTDMTLEFGPEECTIKPVKLDEFTELARRWEIGSLERQAAELFSFSGSLTIEGNSESELTEDLKVQSIEDYKVDYQLIDTEKRLDAWLQEASRGLFLAVDTETDSLDPMQANLVGISLCFEPQKACYIPVKAPEGSSMIDEDQLRTKLRAFFATAKQKLIGQNIKYDKKVLNRWGLDIGPIYFDTMIAAWVVDGSSRYSMDFLAERYLNYRCISFKEIVPKGLNFSDISLDSALNYAAEDADITLQLFQTLKPKVQDQSMDKLFYELEMPLIDVLTSMEERGILLNSRQLQNYSSELAEELLQLEKNAHEMAGKDFNLSSTKQLQEILFEDRKLPVIKKTKTGYSTDTTVLEQLAQMDPLPELILRHRSLSKLKSTYLDKLPGMVNPHTNRIHTNYLQTGTVTGRLSCKDPNLQNIPVRDKEGRRIRQAFEVASGNSLVSADYSQIELVLLAHLSQDEKLIQAFHYGEDIHSQTASILFKTKISDVSPEQRRIAKSINFGVIYGMSAFRLSNEIKIPRKEAADFIDAYFNSYPGVKGFIDKTIRDAESAGGVKTMSGRFRGIPTINSRNKTEQKAAQRMAVNTVIQGSAADIVKKGMIDLQSEIGNLYPDASFLLQVHDEFIFEVKEDETERFIPWLKEKMEKVEKLLVPLRVNCEAGKNWGDIH